MNDSRASPVRALRALAFAAMALIVASCSLMRVGYDHADTLVVASMNHYLGLTSAQQQFVRQRTRALLDWHRATQLRDYASLIESVRAQLGGPVTPSDVLALNQAVNQRFVVLGDRAAPDLAQLALTLTPRQIDHLDHTLSRDAEKARREFDAGTERSLHRSIRRFIERAESWFGDLREDQAQLVRASFRARSSTGDWSIGERVRRQKDLVRLLRRVQTEHPDAAAVTAWLRDYFADLAEPTDPDQRVRVHQFRTDNATLVAELVNSADRGQRAMVSRRLAAYARDFVALAAEGRGG